MIKEEQFAATAAVLTGAFGHFESPQAATDAAIRAVRSAIGNEANANEFVEHLQGLGILKLEIVTAAHTDSAAYPPFFQWRLTSSGLADLQREARPWVQAQIAAELNATRVSESALPWMEPGRDVLDIIPIGAHELAGIAANDTVVRNATADRIRGLIRQSTGR